MRLTATFLVALVVAFELARCRPADSRAESETRPEQTGEEFLKAIGEDYKGKMVPVLGTEMERESKRREDEAPRCARQTTEDEREVEDEDDDIDQGDDDDEAQSQALGRTRRQADYHSTR